MSGPADLPGGASPAGPGPAAGQAPEPGAAAPHRRRQPVLIGFVALMVVSVVASLIVFSVSRSPASDTTPKGAVRGFLDALAAGDATKALSYAADPPTDRALLTDAVLADSNRRAPLHDISVDTVSSGLYKVHYLLGDEAVDDSWTVKRVGDVYRLDYVSWLTLMPVGAGDPLPLLVNGQRTTDTGVDLFPVSYEFTTGLPTATWGPAPTMVVRIGTQDADPVLHPQLTDQGSEEFVRGAQQALRTCLAQHDLAPRGCPFGFDQPVVGPQIDDSTVRWAVEGDPLREIHGSINAVFDSGRAKASAPATFHVTCRYTTGAACEPQSLTRTVKLEGDLTTSPMEVALA